MEQFALVAMALSVPRAGRSRWSFHPSLLARAALLYAEYFLRDTDAMSMCHSLEVRVPFLDAPLIEYVLALPENAKHGARPKALLIEALGPIFCPRRSSRSEKRTFTFPWENWLRGALGKRVAAGLAAWSPALASQLSGDFAQAVWKDFLAGRTTWSRPWSLYVLNEWVKRNVSAGNSSGADCHRSAAVAIS